MVRELKIYINNLTHYSHSNNWLNKNSKNNLNVKITFQLPNMVGNIIIKANIGI